MHGFILFLILSLIILFAIILIIWFFIIPATATTPSSSSSSTGPINPTKTTQVRKAQLSAIPTPPVSQVPPIQQPSPNNGKTNMVVNGKNFRLDSGQYVGNINLETLLPTYYTSEQPIIGDTEEKYRDPYIVDVIEPIPEKRKEEKLVNFLEEPKKDQYYHKDPVIDGLVDKDPIRERHKFSNRYSNQTSGKLNFRGRSEDKDVITGSMNNRTKVKSNYHNKDLIRKSPRQKYKLSEKHDPIMYPSDKEPEEKRGKYRTKDNLVAYPSDKESEEKRRKYKTKDDLVTYPSEEEDNRHRKYKNNDSLGNQKERRKPKEGKDNLVEYPSDTEKVKKRKPKNPLREKLPRQTGELNIVGIKDNIQNEGLPEVPSEEEVVEEKCQEYDSEAAEDIDRNSTFCFDINTGEVGNSGVISVNFNVKDLNRENIEIRNSEEINQEIYNQDKVNNGIIDLNGDVESSTE